jgi:hypothetical protein
MGPISPLDILYGYRPALAQGNLFMAHRGGFTSQTLMNALTEAGFAVVTIQREPRSFSLWAIAFASPPSEQELMEAQYAMFPLHAAMLAQKAS